MPAATPDCSLLAHALLSVGTLLRTALPFVRVGWRVERIYNLFRQKVDAFVYDDVARLPGAAAACRSELDGGTFDPPEPLGKASTRIGRSPVFRVGVRVVKEVWTSSRRTSMFDRNLPPDVPKRRITTESRVYPSWIREGSRVSLTR